MSLKRKADMDRIIEILSYLRSQVELSNPGNFTDINIYAENFYRDFLNLIFGYELKNINIVEPNSAAIDLGDEGAKFAVQVTSTSDLTKAKKTVSKFNGKDLHEKYDELVILNISTKKIHKKQLIGDEAKHQLNTSEDIWDISDVLKVIGDSAVGKISNVRDFLETQIIWKNRESVAKEILTFQALIGLLSDENHPAVGDGYIEEPDPKHKIEERFSDHTDYLTSEFMELYSEFGDVLRDVRTHSDLGQVKLRRLSLHLKTYSDQILIKCEGDAKLALDTLVNEFGKRLAESGTEYNTTAIRFFLIEELIRCNVFPNKEAVNV